MTERTALADNRRLRAAVAQQAAELEQRNQRLEQLAVQHMAELERSRRLNDRILESAPVGIICVDAEGRITFANPSAALMMTYSVDELRGQPLRTHMQLSTTRPGASAAADKDPELAGPYQAAGNELCWREDGTSFPIAYETAPLGEPGQSLGTVVTFRDITRERAVEHLKDELISIASHELRTPLTSIRSSLGLLGSGVLGTLPEKGQRMLDIAVRNTDRLIRLVNDILDLERAESGQIQLRREHCNAGELVVQATDGVRSMAEQAGVVLDVRPLDAHLWADSDRLLQVLTNLLSNAIKFSPSGGTVWIEVEDDAPEVIFRVRDEGNGIPADKLESIFDRFGQVQDSDWREKGGTGLGLAISRSIVTQHHGYIWAESTLGAGTTLCVALPAGEPDDSRLSSEG